MEHCLKDEIVTAGSRQTMKMTTSAMTISKLSRSIHVADTDDENEDWDLGLSEDEKEEYEDVDIAAHFQESKIDTAKISGSAPQRDSIRPGVSQVPGAGWAIKKQKTHNNCNGCDNNAPTKAKAEAVKKGAKAADLKDKAYGKKRCSLLSRDFLLSIQEDLIYFCFGFI